MLLGGRGQTASHTHPDLINTNSGISAINLCKKCALSQCRCRPISAGSVLFCASSVNLFPLAQHGERLKSKPQVSVAFSGALSTLTKTTNNTWPVLTVPGSEYQRKCTVSLMTCHLFRSRRSVHIPVFMGSFHRGTMAILPSLFLWFTRNGCLYYKAIATANIPHDYWRPRNNAAGSCPEHWPTY